MITSIVSAGTLQLDEAITAVWADHAAGRIGKTEAEYRDTLLRAQQNLILRPLNGPHPIDAAITTRKLRPPRYQCSPDRETSRNRRRMLARGGHMPPDVRTRYAEGEASALTIIAGEVKHHGYCDLPIDKIAALAGVCRTTVQNAVREARRLGHIHWRDRPQVGRKSKTNIIRIISPEWLAWIKRGPAIGFKTPTPLKNLSPTRMKIQNRATMPVERQGLWSTLPSRC
jgi:hypothetical protein